MKIIHLTPGFYPTVGGIQKYVEDLCLNLIRLGHRSDVVTYDTHTITGERLKKHEVYNEINVYRIPRYGPDVYPMAPGVLNKIKEYDIVHVHGIGFFCDILSAAKIFHRKRMILSTHGGIFHTNKSSIVKKFYFQLWCRQEMKSFDKIIAISRNDERLFSRISKNLIFIPDGINFEKYSHIKRRPEKNTLLFIGRLSPNKRIDHLIELVGLLKSNIAGIRLYVAGSEWKGERKRLENLADRKGLSKNVIFMGEVSEEEKFSLLSKAEFFVSASEYEGFGISVVEAMAAGLPVIASDIESFRNIITNGENGFLADYSNPETVKSLLLGIKNSDISKISKNAREEAKKYGWKTLVKKIEYVYRNSGAKHD
jgi:alpha-1,3-mannosyltransferase